MIAIVDYQMGNLHSVQKAFERIGADARITDQADEIARADKLVLPGVGAFRDAISHLNDRDLVGHIRDYIASGRPFLGICLGLQLLFEKSYEDGEYDGLGVLAGSVVRFDVRRELKVPHMGWNQLLVRRKPPIFEGIADGAYVYFVHSYYVVPRDGTVIATETDYGIHFASTIWKDNVFATQFHPEKSQCVGLALLRNFAGL
jgi:glutamine amidotransferase